MKTRLSVRNLEKGILDHEPWWSYPREYVDIYVYMKIARQQAINASRRFNAHLDEMVAEAYYILCEALLNPTTGIQNKEHYLRRKISRGLWQYVRKKTVSYSSQSVFRWKKQGKVGGSRKPFSEDSIAIADCQFLDDIEDSLLRNEQERKVYRLLKEGYDDAQIAKEMQRAVRWVAQVRNRLEELITNYLRFSNDSRVS